MSEEDALPQPRHEPTDITFRSILIAALCMGTRAAAAHSPASPLWLFHGEIPRRHAHYAGPLLQTAFPDPQLQPSPAVPT